MANIYDIAREAGVSITTVSRVLNGKSEVNKETRDKVLTVIAKLEYSPNSSAQALAMHKTNTLGVVSPGLNDPFYAQIINGIYEAADQAGYGVLFCLNKEGKSKRINYFDILYGKVDGIIFIGEDAALHSEIVKLTNKNYPIVLIESDINIPGAVTVNINNYQGAYTATQYLVQLGHKRIAHIAGKLEYFDSSERLKGYSQALKDNSIEIDESLIKVGNYSYIESYESSMELLTSGSKFSAVFCASDNMAVGFMRAALETGLKIPEDISVVGFDDVVDSNFLSSEMPPLTTIRESRNEMAVYAVNSLIYCIKEKKPKRNKVFEAELVIRQSTAGI